VNQFGLTPLAAIAAATGQSAPILGIDADAGTIQPGRCADLLVVDGDPTVDITALRQVRAVLRSGRVVVEGGRVLA